MAKVIVIVTFSAFAHQRIYLVKVMSCIERGSNTHRKQGSHSFYLANLGELRPEQMALSMESQAIYEEGDGF